MGNFSTDETSETTKLLKSAALGDQRAWGDLLTRNRERLRRMVALRLDQRLKGRIDASDVIQDAFVDASAQLAVYLQNPQMPFYLWLRFLTGIRLAKLHRHHLGAQMRDAGREIRLLQGYLSHASSAALAAQLLGRDTRPSEAAMRSELKIRLQELLNDMDPIDREVLALRHFEQLTTAEAAQVLGIKEDAAGKRYIRALERLRDLLVNTPGGLEEFLL
jgi:RNA polymerase sigma-70 factor (ECF subfamily)